MKPSFRVACAVLLPALLVFASCRPAPEKAAQAATPSAPAKPPATPLPLPVIGPSPEWSVTTIDDRKLGRDDLKGKVVVVDFWATWCLPCVYEIPDFVRLQEKYRDQGVVFVGITADQNMERLNDFIRQKGMLYPVALLTDEVAERFGEKELVMPTTYLIDREGRVRHRKVGPADPEDYEKLIRSLL